MNCGDSMRGTDIVIFFWPIARSVVYIDETIQRIEIVLLIMKIENPKEFAMNNYLKVIIIFFFNEKVINLRPQSIVLAQ